jgi:hypothetical protein
VLWRVPRLIALVLLFAGEGEADLPTERLQCARCAMSSGYQLRAATPYEFAEWRIRRVGIDHHVDVEFMLPIPDSAPEGSTAASSVSLSAFTTGYG